MGSPESRRALRWHRRSMGLCPKCGDSPKLGFISCHRHIEKRTKEEREARRKGPECPRVKGIAKIFMVRFKSDAIMKGKIEEIAEIENMTQSTLIREAIERYLEDYDELMVERSAETAKFDNQETNDDL